MVGAFGGGTGRPCLARMRSMRDMVGSLRNDRVGALIGFFPVTVFVAAHQQQVSDHFVGGTKTTSPTVLEVTDRMKTQGTEDDAAQILLQFHDQCRPGTTEQVNESAAMT